MNHIFRRRGIVAGGIALTLAAALIGCSSASDDSGSTGGTSDDVTVWLRFSALTGMFNTAR